MDVLWSATDPKTRRFSAAPVRSDSAALEDRVQRLRKRRIRGYLEAEIPDTESPQLTMGFRGEYAVIHMIVEAPEPLSFLLLGDGSVPDEAYVQLPVMDELARFYGDVVQEVEHAWHLMQAFLRTGRPDDLGEWRAL
ncbi:hypothetical protein [Actinoplanes palleronii]|nr:hypothetical protein [Actinoplanes palleronii]